MSDLLHTIQQTLVAKKSKYNSFGKYNYRSCEDIVEGIKEVLPEGASLIMSDEVVMLGERFYIKATVSLHHDNKIASAVGYAREALEQKGMSEGQITGSASSYARKYALCGLFAIDDGIDDDSEKGKDSAPKPAKAPKVDNTPAKPPRDDSPKGVSERLIVAAKSQETFGDLKGWESLPIVKDARDKLFIDNRELSDIVEEVIAKLREELPS